MSTASGDEYLVADASLAVAADVPAANGPARRNWPFGLVALVAAGGLILVLAGRFTIGVQVLAVAMAIAAALRLVLPASFAGWLANRSRLVDAVCFAGLAVALTATLALIG